MIALTREALIDAPLNYITGRIFRRERARGSVPPVFPALIRHVW